MHFDSAIADFTKAIELKPNDASAYTNRGSAHYEKAEFDRAIADLNKALEINPKSALAYCNLGWTYEAIGDEREAIAHYRKALEIDPSLEAARDNLKLLGATPAFSLADKAQELKGLIAGIFPSGRWLLARVDRRCGTHEQTHKLGLLRSAGLRVNVLQVGLGRVLADPQHLSRFFYAKPWHHGEEHT